jgi:hypothetical protein
VPLPADIGSDAFNSAYLAALAGQSETKGRARSVHAAGSIAALIASYLCSAGYRSLRQTTKAGYASRIEVLRTQHGHRAVQGLTRERIVAVLQPYAARPGAALSILKMLRVLIRHAIDIGWLKNDPSFGIKRPKTQEIRSWSDREIEAFEYRWPIGTKQRLAFALLLYTGQRRSDVHRMTWADVSGETIRVVQQKTGRKLAIPLHRELLTALAAANRDSAALTEARLRALAAISEGRHDFTATVFVPSIATAPSLPARPRSRIDHDWAYWTGQERFRAPMPISTNIQIIVVALLNVLLAFSCGAVFGAWIAGHTPDLWTVVLPACILLVFFALLTALVWRRDA